MNGLMQPTGERSAPGKPLCAKYVITQICVGSLLTSNREIRRVNVVYAHYFTDYPRSSFTRIAADYALLGAGRRLRLLSGRRIARRSSFDPAALAGLARGFYWLLWEARAFFSATADSPDPPPVCACE